MVERKAARNALTRPSAVLWAAIVAILICAPASVLAQDPGEVAVTECTEAALRQAIAEVPAGGTVRLGCDGTIPVTGGPIEPMKGFTIDATGRDVALSGQDTNSIFFLSGPASAPVTVTLRGFTIRDGRTDLSIGAAGVTSFIELVLDDMRFVDNVNEQRDGTDGLGGAVSSRGPVGSVRVTDSEFVGNRVVCGGLCRNGGGGAILLESSGASRIERSMFRGNSMLGRGGGGAVLGRLTRIEGRGGPITIVDSVFEDNIAEVADESNSPSRGGGAVAVFSQPLTIEGSRFDGNEVGPTGGNGQSHGGAVRIGADDAPGATIPPARIVDSEFTQNVARPDLDGGGGRGGAVAADRNLVEIENSSFVENEANAGGALWKRDGEMTVTDSLLEANTALGGSLGTGGGLWTLGKTTFVDTDVIDNAPNGCFVFDFADATPPRKGEVVDGGGNTERPGTSCGFDDQDPPQPHRCAGALATITGSGDGDPIRGTPGRDVIVGTSGQDLIRGKGGNDLVCGRGGNDHVFGGLGREELRGNSGEDTLVGNKGRDQLLGQGGDDTLRGGQAADELRGNGGDDSLFGGRGADKLLGQGGDDTCNGGKGGGSEKGC